MKWSIPAKTFLLGEYAAIAGNPAIILTTFPCFELSKSHVPGLQGIHPESPAGRWWSQYGLKGLGLQWFDPYQGRGGMGASSAQFIGVYQAMHDIQSKPFSRDAMLVDYLQYAWRGIGLRPSGYDVLAQTACGSVYIHQQVAICKASNWPFHDLAFVLLHTGQKLATHEHLQSLTLPNQFDEMIAIVGRAKAAIDTVDSVSMIDAVNAYHQALLHRGKVAEHSLQSIQFFQHQPDVLAVKGCGAMGADVLLLLVSTKLLSSLTQRLGKAGWRVLATSDDLYLK